MGIQERRDLRVDIDGFPVRTFKNTGDFSLWSIDFTREAKTKRFAPMDTIEIRNRNGSVDLPFTINDGAVADDECGANGSRKIVSETPNINKITFDGSGGVLVAGDILVSVTRQGLTADEFRRRQAGKGILNKLLSVLA